MYEYIIKEMDRLAGAGVGIGIAPVYPRKPAANKKPPKMRKPQAAQAYKLLKEKGVTAIYRVSPRIERELTEGLFFTVQTMARGLSISEDITRILILDPRAKKRTREDHDLIERIPMPGLPEAVWIVKGEPAEGIRRTIIFFESEHGHLFPTGKVEGLGSAGPVGIGTPAYDHTRPTNVVMVITRGVAALPDSDRERIAVAVSKVAASPHPEPSFIILDPAKKPPRGYKTMSDEEVLEHYVDDEGRTLHLPFQGGSTKIYIKKDDFRRVAPEDKKTWGVPAATEYIITALLPEEY